jgi:NADH dehydrogenase [ubiquinone] 1 alpha subcomplex assembly factor 3
MLAIPLRQAFRAPALRIVSTQIRRPASFTLLRNFHATRPALGTTTLPNILAGGPAPPVVVESLTSEGLKLADGLKIPGACIFLEGEVLLWDVPSPDTWAKMKPEEVQERFQVFEVVVPKPGSPTTYTLNLKQDCYQRIYTEILILGTGKSLALPPPKLREYLNQLGIQLDVMDTVSCSSLFSLSELPDPFL